MSSWSERARGATWGIWDLHVHSPASLVSGYSGDTDESWARYLDDLEALPSDFKVIGINDYWFLDGYRRVRRERDQGRLSNLAAIFPVVEFRLDQFGGVDGDLKRANFHVIFDPDLDPDVIQNQFLSNLTAHVELSPGLPSSIWNGVITREALADLGAQIRASLPDGLESGSISDLLRGFNNLNVSYSALRSALENTYVAERHVTAVGKTEWSAIKWNEQSVAAKKTLVNSADLLFTAFHDAGRWDERVGELRENKVNSRLLDCSDAHHFSDSPEPTRIGNCSTWVNSTPTLAGLKYALREFERRVFVGLEPPTLGRIRRNPARFIDHVEVSSTLDPEDRVLDYSIPLNAGFVAVIGNKGQGKSAFLDCVASAGNSTRSSDYAFLNRRRFLAPSNRSIADAHYAELSWVTGKSRRVELSRLHDAAAPTEVEYLPQAFVERVCRTDAVDPESDDFEDELRAVLFTHIPEEERSGESDFDSLLRQRTRAPRDDIEGLRSLLEDYVVEYAEVARFRASLNVDQVEQRISVQARELEQADVALTEAQEALVSLDVAGGENQQLGELRATAEQVEERRALIERKLSENAQRRASLARSVTGMAAVLRRVDALGTELAALNIEAIDHTGGDVELVELSVNRDAYAAWLLQVTEELELLEEERSTLEVSSGLVVRELQEVGSQLAAMDGARERARKRVLDARARRELIIGSESDAESLRALQLVRDRLQNAPDRMSELRGEMLGVAQRIFEQLEAQRSTVEALYAPASDFIGTSPVLSDADLQFVSELRIRPEWQKIADSLDRRKNGGLPEEIETIPQTLQPTSWSEIKRALENIVAALEVEGGGVGGSFRDPSMALKGSIDLSAFLIDLLGLGWLDVRFALNGYGKPLSLLSPGQRGLMLALFYLVVDRRDSPLLLDQPEENLDNATIASRLVPAIHDAAGRRQTIVVTHNANLAVVGDADQVIHCEYDNKSFSVEGGSIADLDVAQLAIDVLEGTMRAFSNRRDKYDSFPGLE